MRASDMGATRDEAFQAVREHYLFPPEEPGLEEKLPVSVAYEAVVEMVKTLQEINDEGED